MAEDEDYFGTLKPTPAAKGAPPSERRPSPRPVDRKVPIAQPLPKPEPLPGEDASLQAAAPALAPKPSAACAPPKPEVRTSVPVAPGGRRLAAETARNCSLSAAARALLDEKHTILAYLYGLMNGRLYVDAVRFLAQALPIREGVFWACESVETMPANLSAPSQNALRATRRWLEAGNEANRCACGAAARVAGYGTAAGSAALAAFFSDGRIALPGRPVGTLGVGVAGQAVANAVLLHPLANEPQTAPERWFGCLKKGVSLLTNASPCG